VDENGEPLVVYHWTPNDFDTFDRSKLGKNTEGKSFVYNDDVVSATAYLGFWFNNEINTNADMKEINENLIPAFLNIKNPRVESSLGNLLDRINEFTPEDTEVYEGEDGGIYAPDDYVEPSDYADNYLSVIDDADGIIIQKDNEFGGISFVAFDPNQIKSTDNLGTVSREQKNILFQSGDADTEGMDKQIETAENARKKRKEREAATYRADLEKALAGKLKYGRHIRVGTALQVYVKYGLFDASLNLPVSILKKAVEEKHDVSMADMERLPELINSPIAIFRSLTDIDSLVAVVNMKDQSGRQVIVILRPTDTGINVIPSVYGKDNFDAFVKKNH
jgi:hypothetical protein